MYTFRHVHSISVITLVCKFYSGDTDSVTRRSDRLTEAESQFTELNIADKQDSWIYERKFKQPESCERL